MYNELKLNANWKLVFQSMWNATPKKLRKNKKQINALKSKAKLFTLLYC